MTAKLYKTDVYMKEWDASITSCHELDTSEAHGEERLFILTLDRTAFFPEGGGQSCDKGVIGTWQVDDVQEKNEEVYHKIVVKPSEEIPSLKNVSPVHCTIDWDRRFDNMQRHCGEHILSGIFYALYGGVNRGFHMGDEYMTIDIRLEENPEFTHITDEMALKAQLETNKVIWSDAPVTVLHFENRAEAEKMPLRKALAFDEDISIVCVGSTENAADCVACCGTHPSTAGQVGLVKIYKVEKYKDMFRIYFDAGQRALKDYNNKHEILTDISNHYSSSTKDLPKKLKVQEEKMASVKNELFHLKQAFTKKECIGLDEVIASSNSNTIVYPLPHFSMDDAFNMGKRYMKNTDGRLIMLYSPKNTSYVLISDGNINCGRLVKEYASFYNGKGGGNDISARAIFSCDEDAALFADLIEKHLK